MIHLLLATRNLHKAREIQTILGSICRCGTLRDFEDAPQVVEDADTFEGNALKKAETLAKWLRQTRNFECGTGNNVKLVLADDSGLEVDELGGAPGVHSARFAALDTGAAGNSSDVDNNAKLLRLLADTPSKKRSARFRCVLAVVPVTPRSPFPSPCCFEGVCEGRIGFEPRGSNGFGYDPLFVPNGFEQTFAELSEEEKNAISHRSKALTQLKSALASRAV